MTLHHSSLETVLSQMLERDEDIDLRTGSKRNTNGNHVATEKPK